jgi:isoquinoline 1-oxidoreductase subunit alpha
MTTLTVNGKRVDVDVPSDMPLLWVIRDTLGMTGTKFGCGIAQCGACTIEGLSPNGTHKLQRAWIAEQTAQCGYCQSGQIMQAASLLAQKKNPTRTEIVNHMAGNLCRCGTYNQIVAAVERAAKMA